MNRQKTVKAEFFRITGIPPFYKTNFLADKKIRGNYIFGSLAEKIFDHPRLLGLLSKKIAHWLRWDDSAFTLALAGYIAYLDERYHEAEQFFLRALKKDKRNIDLWFDLAFSLYHQDEKQQKLAHDILFKHKELAERFPKNKLHLQGIREWLHRQPPYRITSV